MLALSQGSCAVSALAIQNMDMQASYSDVEILAGLLLQCFSGLSHCLICGLVITRPAQMGGELTDLYPLDSCTLPSGYCCLLAVSVDGSAVG